MLFTCHVKDSSADFLRLPPSWRQEKNMETSHTQTYNIYSGLFTYMYNGTNSKCTKWNDNHTQRYPVNEMCFFTFGVTVSTATQLSRQLFPGCWPRCPTAMSRLKIVSTQGYFLGMVGGVGPFCYGQLTRAPCSWLRDTMGWGSLQLVAAKRHHGLGLPAVGGR